MARQHVAAPHPLPPLPLPSVSLPDVDTGIPPISQSLAAARHLMEMHPQSLHQPSSRRILDRLENRLGKLMAELGEFYDPQCEPRLAG
jgi:hypothetical protein